MREHMADLMRYFHDVLAAEDEVEFADYLLEPAPFDSTRCSAWIWDSKHRSTGPVFHQCRSERCNDVNRFCEQHSRTKTLTYGEWGPDSHTPLPPKHTSGQKKARFWSAKRVDAKDRCNRVALWVPLTRVWQPLPDELRDVVQKKILDQFDPLQFTAYGLRTMMLDVWEQAQVHGESTPLPTHLDAFGTLLRLVHEFQATSLESTEEERQRVEEERRLFGAPGFAAALKRLYPG